MANLDDSNVEALICFCCARRFPNVDSIGSNEIKWVTPCEDPSLFLGMSHREAEKILGLATYLKRYGHCAGQGMPNLNLWPARRDRRRKATATALLPRRSPMRKRSMCWSSVSLLPM